VSNSEKTYSFDVQQSFNTETGLVSYVVTLDDLHKVLDEMNKQAQRLQAENERLRKAGDAVVAAYCMGDAKVEKWKEYPVVREWLAAKGVQS